MRRRIRITMTIPMTMLMVMLMLMLTLMLMLMLMGTGMGMVMVVTGDVFSSDTTRLERLQSVADRSATQSCFANPWLDHIMMSPRCGHARHCPQRQRGSPRRAGTDAAPGPDRGRQKPNRLSFFCNMGMNLFLAGRQVHILWFT